MSLRLRPLILGIALLFSLSLPTYADTVTIVVPGTSDMWLAGMPAGSPASLGDLAPPQSPVPVPGIPVGILTFSVTGGVLNFDECPPFCDGPDGGPFISHLTGGENGLSDAIAGLNALMGVFLDASQPDLSPAPGTLDFQPGGLGTSFSTLSPGLKQVFFIGDGLTGTGSGSVQTFVVPAGATRLYLGTMDGYGWFNNSGSFSVTINDGVNTGRAEVPEPTSLILLGTGLVSLAGYCARKRT